MPNSDKRRCCMHEHDIHDINNVVLFGTIRRVPLQDTILGLKWPKNQLEILTENYFCFFFQFRGVSAPLY